MFTQKTLDEVFEESLQNKSDATLFYFKEFQKRRANHEGLARIGINLNKIMHRGS